MPGDRVDRTAPPAKGLGRGEEPYAGLPSALAAQEVIPGGVGRVPAGEDLPTSDHSPESHSFGVRDVVRQTRCSASSRERALLIP